LLLCTRKHLHSTGLITGRKEESSQIKHLVYLYMDCTSVRSLVSEKRAVIFDLFHTLTAPEVVSPNGQPTSEILGLDRRRWNAQLMEKSKDRLRGLEKDPYEIIAKLAHAIDPDLSEDIIRRATQNRIARFEDALLKIPESTQIVIKQLKQQGLKVALVSNADVIECAAWNRSPVAPFFDVALFSCEVGLVKPDVEIYELCLQKLNEKPEDCLFVGDGGSNEFVGAKLAGLTTIMTTYIAETLWPHKLDAIKEHADWVIKHLHELVDDCER
jgi:putative hydrolase of the HAD superfamily